MFFLNEFIKRRNKKKKLQTVANQKKKAWAVVLIQFQHGLV